MMNPFTSCHSCSEISSTVPYSEANTPPLSMSPTRTTGAFACSATAMFTMSPDRRLISAGLPAPSTTTMSYLLRSVSSASVTIDYSRFLRVRKSTAWSLPRILPIVTSCDVLLPSGLSRTGFISTLGSTLAASA